MKIYFKIAYKLSHVGLFFVKSSLLINVPLSVMNRQTSSTFRIRYIYLTVIYWDQRNSVFCGSFTCLTMAARFVISDPDVLAKLSRAHTRRF